MSRIVFVLLLVTAASALAGEDPLASFKKGQPKAAADLIDRIVGCNHWSGEEPYNLERQKEIQSALTKLQCGKLQSDEAKLVKRFGESESLRKAINAAKQFSY